jgi:[ribosomal protein S18]-alanine N-acetyltransferase
MNNNSRIANILIRPATDADIPQMIELARRSWLSAFAQTAPFALIQFWAAADRESSWYPTYWHSMSVAEMNGAIAGLVQPKLDEINGLWVHPSAQGKGVGTALLNEGEGQIRDAGYEKGWLNCSGFNTGAQNFYKARGYVMARSYTEELKCGVMAESLIFEKTL